MRAVALERKEKDGRRNDDDGRVAGRADAERGRGGWPSGVGAVNGLARPLAVASAGAAGAMEEAMGLLLLLLSPCIDLLSPCVDEPTTSVDEDESAGSSNGRSSLDAMEYFDRSRSSRSSFTSCAADIRSAPPPSPEPPPLPRWSRV